MKLGGTAAYVVKVVSETELLEALEFAAEKNVPYKMIGSGSNLVWAGDYPGLVIVNDIMGLEINGATVTIASGENWDSAVERTVKAGLSGIEFLSLIPGTVGATPVQNVGAYGAEIADVLVSVRAYDTETDDFVTLKNSECEFGYRISRFNQQDAGRFLITQITLELSQESPTPPFYKTLQQYVDNEGVTEYTPANIRAAVIAVRQARLPDPAVIPNCGSFFKNPIITQAEYDALVEKYPELPGWEHEGQMKVPAAWLLDQLGFKNYTDDETGMATYEKHPLVVINKSATSVDQLHAFKQKLVDAVQKEFGITLEQEPELVQG